MSPLAQNNQFLPPLVPGVPQQDEQFILGRGEGGTILIVREIKST